METCFLDTETTGLSADDEILEVAICDERGETRLNSLVKPQHQVAWPAAQKINSISPDLVASAPSLIELLPAIRAAVAGRQVVIYNAQFDVRFFPAGTFHGCDVKCCMLAYARQIGEWDDYRDSYRWHKLISAAAHVGHTWDGAAHRALADARATMSVWQWLQAGSPELEHHKPDPDVPF